MIGDHPDNMCKVLFIPDNIEIDVKREAKLLDSAVKGGVHVSAPCGCFRICGTCKVKIESGSVESKPSFSHHLTNDSVRLRG